MILNVKMKASNFNGYVSFNPKATQKYRAFCRLLKKTEITHHANVWIFPKTCLTENREVLQGENKRTDP